MEKTTRLYSFPEIGHFVRICNGEIQGCPINADGSPDLPNIGTLGRIGDPLEDSRLERVANEVALRERLPMSFTLDDLPERV